MLQMQMRQFVRQAIDKPFVIFTCERDSFTFTDTYYKAVLSDHAHQGTFLFAVGVKEKGGQKDRKTVVEIKNAGGVGVYLNRHSLSKIGVWVYGVGDNNLRGDLRLIH